MPRFFLPPDSWNEEAWLTGDEAKHLSQVMRIRAGESVTVFDGGGRRAEAVVRQVARDRVGLALGESIHLPRMNPAMTWLSSAETLSVMVLTVWMV